MSTEIERDQESCNRLKAASPTPPAPAEVCERLKQSLETVRCYLGNGGLFNPEFMEHDKVRDMVMDMRDRITAALALISQGEKERERLEQEREVIRNLCSSARDTAVTLVDAQKGPNNVMRVEGPQRLKDALNDIMEKLPYAARAQPTPESK